MIDKLKKFLAENNDFTLSKTGSLKLKNGKRISNKLMLESLTPDKIPVYDLQDEFFKRLIDETAIAQALDEIQKSLVKQKSDREFDGLPIEYMPENIRIGVDRHSKEVHVLNKEYEKLSIKVEAWKEVFGHKVYNESHKVFCDMKYDPYSLEKVRGGELVKKINTCVHPSWRYEDFSKTKKLDPLFLEFYTKLFSNKGSMQYTCSWILNSIFNRNETALVMVGGKGVGKNILCSSFNRMVGSSNVSNQANNAYTEKFNGFLKNSRIVIADEVSFKDGDQKNRVKKYFNKIQSIEEKGRDSETIEVFCSLVMLSNDVRDLYIEADDRRFSCVDLSLTTLPERFTPEQINELRNYIEYDKDFPLAFYQFCKANEYANFVNALPYKGDTFDKLVMSSLSEVKTAILDKIVEGCTEGFALKDLNFEWDVKYPRRKPSFYYFEEFMTNFRYEGKKLGTITKSNRTLDYYISVNPELRASGFQSKL